MSGGSYNYAYESVRAMAKKMLDETNRHCTTKQVFEIRYAFAHHLLDVAVAMKDVEWVDSCDKGEGDEVSAIIRALRSRPNGSIFMKKESNDE